MRHFLGESLFAICCRSGQRGFISQYTMKFPALGFLLAITSLLSPLSAAEQPNVVFILTDDQRFDALGVAGHPHLKTPHIDRLAEESMI